MVEEKFTVCNQLRLKVLLTTPTSMFYAKNGLLLKVSSSEIKNKESEFYNLATDKGMKVNLMMTMFMDKVCSIEKMDQLFKAHGRKED